jgi:hypothetical protein
MRQPDGIMLEAEPVFEATQHSSRRASQGKVGTSTVVIMKLQRWQTLYELEELRSTLSTVNSAFWEKRQRVASYL